MSTEFIEPIIIKIDEILQAGMVDKLDEIDMEKDDFILEDIRKYYQCEKILIPEYPSIETYPTESPGEDKSYNSVQSFHQINIRCFAMSIDGDEEKLMKKIWRYLRAITELVKATDDLETTVDLCTFAGHEYSNIEQVEGGALLYGGIAKFIITKEEVVQ